MGTDVEATRFEIKVLHESNGGKEPFAQSRNRKELSDATKGFEDAVLAFERIGCGWRPLLEGELQEYSNSR